MLVHIQTVPKCKKEVVASFVIVFNVTLCFGNYNSVLRDALQKKIVKVFGLTKRNALGVCICGISV